MKRAVIIVILFVAGLLIISHRQQPHAEERTPISVQRAPHYLGEVRDLLGVDAAGKLIWDSGLPSSSVEAATHDGGVLQTVDFDTGIESIGSARHVRWRRHMCALLAGFDVDSAGNVFVGCGSTVIALDPNGRVRWQTEPGRYVASGFAFSRHAIYVEGTLANVRSYGPDAVWSLTPTGAGRWQSTIDKISGVKYAGLGDETNTISAIAAAPNGTLYVATSGYLTAISPTGERKWRYDMPVDTDETHAIVIGRNGRIYAAGGDTFSFGVDGGFIQALTADGHLVWTAKTDQGYDQAVLGPDGSLHATAGDRVFRYRTP